MNIEREKPTMTRLDQFIAEGLLIREAWVGTDAEGRETACLLAALSPEVAEVKSADACPASVMPAWLAHLTPWLDDEGSDEAWPALIRRYAAIAPRFGALSEHAKWRVLAAISEEAARHTTDEAVKAVCAEVSACYLAAVDAGVLDQGRLSAAEAAARAAAHAAAWAATDAAAWAAAWAAAEASRASAAAWAAAWAAAEAAAVDQLQDRILTILEEEVALERGIPGDR